MRAIADDRQPDGHRLARARLGGHANVAALHVAGEDGFLNRREAVEAPLLQGRAETGRDVSECILGVHLNAVTST